MAIFKLIWLSQLAFAERPTEGGFFSFEPSDVVETYDLERIRIHYSVSGPNQTLLTDHDYSGVPDYVELVAEVSVDVMAHFESLGFKLPLFEDEMGLTSLGGSNALDWYLVDFGGSADGQFGIDACIEERCSGYIVMENDFNGYGYPTREEAVRTLSSHEYFHAIQAAYHASRSDWLSEGTAVWAEHSYDNTLMDFFWLCSAYLEDTGRSIDSPPVGAVSSFSYGTGLFYAFLVEQYGPEGMVILQNILSDPSIDDLDGLLLAITDMGGTLSTDWVTFSEWNLATDFRAGQMESYPYADSLFGLVPEGEGTLIRDDHRFYPLASTYYRIDHGGGALQFVVFDETEGVRMSLHPVANGLADGPVESAIDRWSVTGPMERRWELPAGGYWLIGSYPTAAEQSEKFEFCIGPESDCILPHDNLSDTGFRSAEQSSKNPSGCQAVNPGGMLWSLTWLMALASRRFSLQEN